MGIEECELLGGNISNTPPARIFSSPVGRCLNTGTAICRGANWDIEVEGSTLLGNPGPFIEDDPNLKIVEDYAKKALLTGDWSIWDNHVNGHKILGFNHRSIGAKKIAEAFMPTKSEYVICISHDSIIAAIMASYNLKPLDGSNQWMTSNWPDPLQGVVLEKL
jgi:broad specificity phosphatase PhoE